MTDKHKLPSDFNVLTFTTPCPSCGGQVEFASTGSVMAVCEYCQTTVIRSGDEVKSQGKQSQTIEDYSPIQVGSVGNYGDNQFAIVGRVQYQYAEGIWNEWYIQFSNGHSGWLSEALGQYSITLDKGEHSSMPSYQELWINQVIHFEDVPYTVTDKRMATAVAGEGELPFVMGKGFNTWVADARYQRQFISLEYHKDEHNGDNNSDINDWKGLDVPTVSKGFAIPFDNLNMQMLKDHSFESPNLAGADLGTDPTHIKGSVAGQTSKPKNSISKIDCPNCGSPVPYVAKVTDCLICPSCHSEFQSSSDTKEIIKVHSLMQNLTSSLPLGAKARIGDDEIKGVSQFDSKNNSNNIDIFSENGGTSKSKDNPTTNKNSTQSHDYVVIGIQRLQEVGHHARWTEYLLYSFTNGFLWLSEEPRNGWMVAKVLNDFPTRQGNNIEFNGKKWKNDGSYQSRVVFAIGAFNWQVKVDDYMDLTDYESGKDVITAEQNLAEITYTISSPVGKKQIATWFGSQLNTESQPRINEDFGQYKRENTSQYADDWDDGDAGDGHSTFLHLVGGLAISYFFFFSGSFGAFIFDVIVTFIGLFIFTFLTSDEHDYDSIGDILSSVFSLNTSGTKIIAWGIVIISIIINMILFSGTNSSSSSAFFYSSGGGGRTGYSSSGGHK